MGSHAHVCVSRLREEGRVPREVIPASIQETFSKYVLNINYVPGTVLGTCQCPLPLALEMAILFLGIEAGPLEQEPNGDRSQTASASLLIAKQHLVF